MMTKRENLQWEQKKLSKNALQSRKNGTSFLKKKRTFSSLFFLQVIIVKAFLDVLKISVLTKRRFQNQICTKKNLQNFGSK